MWKKNAFTQTSGQPQKYDDSMETVSENTTQNSRKKYTKANRSRSIVARKVIAFEELINLEHHKNSARRASSLLEIPNSTMKSWREQKQNDEELEVFIGTPAGANFLEKNILAVMKISKYGPSGIRGIQEYLRLTELDRFVASSVGALQSFCSRCEEAIVRFGEEQEQQLVVGMAHRKITLGLDEMFRGHRSCLVGMDVVSNYIFLEKFTEDRTAVTWKKTLDKRLQGFDIEVLQVVSDLCGAIRLCAKEMQAKHIPDLFHSQQELKRATFGPLASQKKSTQNRLEQKKRIFEKVIQSPPSIVREKRKWQKREIEELENQCDRLEAEFKNKEERQESAREVFRELGEANHPIDLKTGKIQTASDIEKRFDEQFHVIQTCAKKAKLSRICFDRIEKSRRAFTATIDYLKYFFIFLEAFINGLSLSLVEEKFFREVIFPLSYLRLIWKKSSKRVKEKYQHVLDELEAKIRAGPWSEDEKKMLMTSGKELAEMFQRSSSCVEGRNGVLSLNHHRFHRLNPKALRALTVMHNFDVRRWDGTTAAERLFGKKHDKIFDFLVANIRIPGKPQKQQHKRNERLVA